MFDAWLRGSINPSWLDLITGLSDRTVEDVTKVFVK